VEAITALTATRDRTTALQCVVDQACSLTGVPYGAIVVVDAHGRPTEVFQHGHDVDGLAPTGMDGTPITVRGHTLGLLYLADHGDGTPLDVTESATVRALASVAGYVLEHASAQAAAERRRVWHNHAASLSSTLQPPFDFATADRTVAEVAMGAGGAVAASLARIVDGELVVTARRGAVPEWVASEEHEAAVHALLDGTTREATAGPDHVALLAPMSTHLSPAGALALYFPAGSPPDEAEVDLLDEFAQQSALALDRARAFQEREQMALVTDRDRIARELHDVVIQRLFATGLHLQKTRAMATDADLQERLSLAVQDLDQTIRAIRGSIFDLQPRPAPRQ
jgi:signal transduction histidine kinase